MGTHITLSLNGVDIDWGKNRHWKSHYWLFPPGSLVDVEYLYAGDAIETKPGFQTRLDEAYFRLCHLGYSHQETKTKFNSAVDRWNRTADLDLSFEDFHGTITSLDFGSLTREDMKPYIWDFRAFVVDLLAAWDTDESHLEDFIRSLDCALILRVLADRADNRSLPLRWHHQDLIDSGWVTLEDLVEIDRQTFIVNHTTLFGRLHDYAGVGTIRQFDNWLVSQGLPRRTPYSKLKSDGTAIQVMSTLPVAVRNMIHHPENPHNALSDDEIHESLELLLGIAKLLESPLTGII